MQTHKYRAGAIAASLLLAAAVQAAAARAESFYTRPQMGEAVLSPSGHQLAITSGIEGQMALSVFDLETGKPRRVARFNQGDIVDVHWVNDGRLIFGLATYVRGGGRGMYAVNADGSEMRRLIEHVTYRTFGDEVGVNNNTQASANHVLLRVPAPQAGAVNDEVLVAAVEWDEPHRQTPRWLNTLSGRLRSVDASVPDDAVDWLTDRRGELRVAMTLNKGRSRVLWRQPGRNDWLPLYESGLLDAPFTPVAVDGLGQLYVTQARGPAGEEVLSRYDFERHAPAAEPLVVTPGFDFSGQLLQNDTGELIGVRVLLDRETTVWIDPVMKALQEEADDLFPGYSNSISCQRCGTPDMVALVSSRSDRDPGHYSIYQAHPRDGEKHWRAVGRAVQDIHASDMATKELHRTAARDGLPLPVWITRPAHAEGPLPAVVLVHGGPWVRGGRWQWDADAQFLASRGYVVIEPEFRGSAGYGDRHFRAGFKQWGQAMQDDVADALHWARQQGIASDKACIAGASYGGYSTLMGLVRDPDLYRCGIAWLAVTDLDLTLNGSWWVRDDATSTQRRFTMPEMIGDADKDAAMIAANSPVRQAARIKAPLLLAFGEEDRRVPLAHGERLRKAMRAAGNEPEWVTYPGEGHGFAIIKNRVDFAQRMEAFLAKHLK